MNDRFKTRRLKRVLLYVLVTSVGLSAMFGIAIVLRNQWSWFETRVVMSTLFFAGASLLGLACDVSRAPRGPNLLPRVGFVLSFLGASLLLVGMWTGSSSELFWKATAVICVFAVATVHVCLLSVAKLAGRFRWVLLLARKTIFGLAGLVCYLFIFEVGHEMAQQLTIGLAILVAAMTLTIPLLHRISRTDEGAGSNLKALESRSATALDSEILQLKKEITKLEMLRWELTGDASQD